jgi:hypothetical protein
VLARVSGLASVRNKNPPDVLVSVRDTEKRSVTPKLIWGGSAGRPSLVLSGKQI